MYKYFLPVFIMTLLYMDVNAQSHGRKSYVFCVGTYTENDTQGIEIIEYNSIKNKLLKKRTLTGVQNPSFLVASKKKGLLFAGEEVANENGGGVVSFIEGRKENAFKKVSSVPTEGDHTCVIALGPLNLFLFAGNYSGGNVTVYLLGEKGQIEKKLQRIDHFGSSIDTVRQEKSHIHDLVFLPNKKQLFVTDLGADRVYIYDFNPLDDQPLKPAKFPIINVKKGSGPRHLDFDTSGSYFYLVNELTADVEAYSYIDNHPKLLQTVSLAVADSDKNRSGAEVKISINGKYLYVSNRGDYNEISVFSIQEDYQLQLIQTINSGGKTPRSFEITPDGRYLIVTNQDSNLVTIFKVLSDGKLENLNASLKISKPVHVVNW